jgi:hypothetical protein
MERSHYLHVHLPGRGRVTLSLPSGVERAIVSGKLTADAQVWHEHLRLWVSVTRHPRMAGLLSLVQLPGAPAAAEPPEPECFDLELPAAIAPVPAPAPGDPAQLPLIPLEEPDEFREFTEFLRRSAAAEERRATVRSSGPRRKSGPARVVVAGAADPVPPVKSRLRRWLPWDRVPTWAAAAALTLLSGLTVGLFFLMTSPGPGGPAAPVMTTNALSANGRGQDSVAELAALASPNVLAAEERELETNLRIAEAVVWQPALDFSPELIGRSARKVDAVRNSISLYRIAAWRQIDSTSRDTDVRLEPYEESVLVDEVLDLVQSAVTLLSTRQGAFRVHGEVLVFSDPEEAARYNWLRNRADSLLRTPLSTDRARLVRAPRRVVGRLVETLPAALVPSP